MSTAPAGELTQEQRTGLLGRLYWTLHDALVLTERGLRQTTRIPELMVFATIQPVMFVLLFRYVFGGAIHVGGGVSYVNYLMAGIFVQTVAFGAMTTGIGLADDLQKGLVDRFRSLPMSRLAVLLGRTLADLVRNVFTVLVMLAVGVAVGFRPHGSPLGWLAAGGLLLIFSFSLSWIGASIGLAVRNVEAVQSAGFIWLFPLTFASSAFVPIATMPIWLRSFAEAQPITKMVDAVRAWALGEPVGSSGWIALAWCLGVLLVFAPLAVRLFRGSATKS
ncbi:MAG TPA: ABC transporter permease [Solirubrobacteraceae bacterium]|jgi:ABC-2 type transport system permease protein/oleandomycin transport system permease protein|nr:ABC transporter permease [Solirubrobacteraceae bacterium]